jgi:hypothetical protein
MLATDHRGERKLPPKVQRLLGTPPDLTRGEASASAAKVGAAAAAAAAAAGVASVEKSGKYAETKLPARVNMKWMKHDNECRGRCVGVFEDVKPVAPLHVPEELPIVRESGAYE